MTEELSWLIEKARTMDSVVEIGAWRGDTTVSFCRACPGMVWAIDPWRSNMDAYEKFIENTKKTIDLIIMRMPSLRAVQLFPDKSVDMVFIDGNHDYKFVKEDILQWTPKAKKLICGHDYNHPDYPGVKHAVDKCVDGAEVYQSIWYKTLS
jgi:precorrin-6B methylase 2